MLGINEKQQMKHKRMFLHKLSRQFFRRCTAMTKIAAIMMFLIFTSGIFRANFDETETEKIKIQDNDGEALLERRERKHEISDVRRTAYDVTTDVTPVDNPTKKNSMLERVTEKVRETTTKPNKKLISKNKKIKVKAVGNEPMYANIEYERFQTKEFIKHEQEQQLEWSEKIKQKKFDEIPPNPSFIFHNKLPKSGSSTMNNILKKLSKANHFNFLKMETTIETSDDQYLVEYLKEKIQKPYLILKHHRWLNFTKADQLQPTYINVMRDPLEWFTSRYYFERYGWERKPGCRKKDCGMTEEERRMEIDDCVRKRHKECLSPWMYLQFFCGTSPECYNVTTLEQKEKATEIAKSNILNEYYVVGVLEHFADSLKLFEVMMPTYFTDAIPTWKSEFVQIKQNLTRTTYKKEMSEESKNFFRNGPLHYEIELYNFALELFNEKLKHFHIKPEVTSR